jgi:hypothetical protein
MATPRRDKDAPPKADPRHGKNPGYAEDQPRDRTDARQLPIESRPNAEDRRGQSGTDSRKGKH